MPYLTLVRGFLEAGLLISGVWSSAFLRLFHGAGELLAEEEAVWPGLTIWNSEALVRG